ncbi:MAG: DUF2062 domain-containing protein [Candidatus Ratteibacteria bacterium]|nr:DUF2062 domain-containing protein [Candidatus Ratteibacteria bacterium]
MKNGKFKKLWGELKKETLSRNNPHQIALGIGVGAFLGVLPLQGFKTALVVLLGSLYKKVNIIAAFAVSTIFSLFPVIPFVYFLDYWIGTKILGMPVIFTIESFKHFNIKMLGGSVSALFVGSAFTGILFGILSYSISLVILELKKTKN